MATTVICPNLRCRKVLSVADELRGKAVKCAHCNSSLRVPDPKQNKPHPPVKTA